jgi:hypothetical protein
LPFKGKDGLIIPVIQLFSKSVGEIILKDKNPFTPPIIDPKYLHHPHDVKLLTEGLFPAHEHILHTAWLTSRIRMCIFFALVAIKLTIKILEESIRRKTMRLLNLNPKLIDAPFPGCESLKIRRDEYWDFGIWECFIRHAIVNVHHPVCVFD